MNAPSRTASNASRSVPKPNKPSKLLNAEENEQVFALLGNKRQVGTFHSFHLNFPLYIAYAHTYNILILTLTPDSTFRSQSQCTAVVQVFTTEPPAHSHWVKLHTGALCFVKDNVKRSYFMRLYCLKKNCLVWEQEVYDPFNVNRPRPYLLTFEGDDRIVCFNFASELEAGNYLQTIHNLISSRMRRKEGEFFLVMINH